MNSKTEVDILTNHTKNRETMEIYETEEGQQLKNNQGKDECQSYVTENDANENHKIDTQQGGELTISNHRKINKFKSFLGQDFDEKSQSILSPKASQLMYKMSNSLSPNVDRRLLTSELMKQDQQYLFKASSLFSQVHNPKGLLSDREIASQHESEEQKQLSSISPKGANRFGNMFNFQTDEQDKEVKLLEKIKKRLITFKKNYTYGGKRQYLESRSVHTTLNDKCDGYFDSKIKNTLILELIYVIKRLKLKFDQSALSKIPVISSQSRINLALTTVTILYNSFFFLLLSIMVVFQNGLSEQDFIFYRATLIIWSVEIVIKLNTTTYKDSNILTDRRAIFLSYFQKKFLPDFVSFLVLIILLFQTDTDQQFSTRTILQVICFVKVINLNQDMEEFQKRLCMMLKRYYFIKLANLIIKLFLIAHSIACAWYIIAAIETHYLGEESTWYTNSVAADGIWWKAYIVSMYWALTLMTTGSNVANSILQIFFTSFIMLFTTIIIGYMLNATGAILEEIDASEENKRNDLNIINEYMREKNISINLQGRVNIYLEYYYQKNYQKQTDDAKGVLQKISQELRCLLQNEYFQQILTKIDFLHRNFTVQTLINLSIQCEEIVYYPNQIIFEENDFRDAALLVIIEGQVEIYQQVGTQKKDQKSICFLKQGQILGQINFFTGMARTASARSKGFTKLAKISRESFLQVVSDHEKDLQTFYQMKDNILLYENYEEMNIKCSACQSYKHLQGNCPLVHLDRSQTMEKVRILNMMRQERKVLKRHRTMKVKSLKRIKENKKRLLEFKEQDLGQIGLKYRYFDEMIEEDEEYDEDDQDDSSSYSIDSNQELSQKKIQTHTSIDKMKALKSAHFPAEKIKIVPEIINQDDLNQSTKNPEVSGIMLRRNRSKENCVIEDFDKSLSQGELALDNKDEVKSSDNEIAWQIYDQTNRQTFLVSSTRQVLINNLQNDQAVIGSKHNSHNSNSNSNNNSMNNSNNNNLVNNMNVIDYPIEVNNSNQSMNMDIKRKKQSQVNFSNSNSQESHHRSIRRQDTIGKKEFDNKSQNSGNRQSQQSAQNQQQTLHQFDSDTSEDKGSRRNRSSESRRRRNGQSKSKRQSKAFENFQSQQLGRNKFQTLILPNQHKRIINEEELEQEKEEMLWHFDKQRDYEYYFNHGNMKIRISQYNQYQKIKEQKQVLQVIAKSLFFRKTKNRISTQIKSKKLLKNVLSKNNIKID